MSKKTVAIIPIKRYSERLPEKNFLYLGSKPMWSWPFETLLSHPKIDSILWLICPDLEDYMSRWYGEMSEVASKYPKKVVNTYSMPREMCKATAQDFLLHAHEVYRGTEDTTYVFTHIINPFINHSMITRALKLHKSYFPHSVIAVNKLQQKVWKERANEPFGIAYNHNPLNMQYTQDLEPLYIETCSLYVFNGKVLENRASHQTDSPVLMEVGIVEGWDIDTREEYEIAQLLVEAGIEDSPRRGKII